MSIAKMDDRDKVAKGLKLCVVTGDFCGECPYDGMESCIEKLHDDALVLLEEQEPVKRTCRTGINGFSIIWTCGTCGSDLHPNNIKAKYCSNCGRAVKWND